MLHGKLASQAEEEATERTEGATSTGIVAGRFGLADRLARVARNRLAGFTSDRFARIAAPQDMQTTEHTGLGVGNHEDGNRGQNGQNHGTFHNNSPSYGTGKRKKLWQQAATP